MHRHSCDDVTSCSLTDRKVCFHGNLQPVSFADVAGGDLVLAADDVGIPGSAHSGRPVHPRPRTSTRAPPAGRDPEP